MRGLNVWLPKASAQGTALGELCEYALCGSDRYKVVTSVPDLIKMFKRDMKYVQGLMGKEEEKAYLDDEWKRLNGKEEGKA